MTLQASGLSQIIDTLGGDLDAAATNRAQMRGLAAGGLLPAGAAPGPSILQRIIGVDALGTPYMPPSAGGTPTPISLGTGASPAPSTASPMSYAPSGLSSDALMSTIGQAAQKRGIDPMTAVRVAMAEGGRSGGYGPRGIGDGGSSFSPFQLHYGGVAAGGNSVPGLGDDFTRDTGLDARDPKNAAATIDYALANASKNGWGAFHGAARAGIGEWDGISRSQGGGPAMPVANADRPIPPQALAFAGSQSPAASSPAPAVAAPGAASPSPASGAGAGPAPTMDQIKALIYEPTTRQLGLQLWQQAISPKDGYTLSENQERYNAQNRLVARGLPKMEKLGQGDMLAPSTGGPPVAYNPPALQHTEIGTDAFGAKQYGTFNPQTGEAKPFAGAPPVQMQKQGDPNLHGEDYLATLPPALAGMVRATAEGRVKLPVGMSANSPIAQRLRAALMQYDPNFDATNTDARFKTRTDFSPGGGPNSAGVAITAGNTAIQHLGELSDAAEELVNSDPLGGKYPLANRIGQAIGSAAGGNVAGTKFNNILGKYVEEATKFYRGAGGTESDIQRDIGNLSPNMSPEQLHAAIGEQVKLMQGKINALQDRWHQGMGPIAGDFPIIQPKSQAALDRIAGRAPKVTEPLSATTGMPMLTDPSQVAKLPSGTHFRTPDGRVKVAP